MAEMLSKSDFDAIKRDIEDAGKTVNTDAVIDPRYGDQYKSFPMLSRLFEAMLDQGLLDLDELNQVIQIAAAAGAGANGWTASLVIDGNKTQKQINDETISRAYANLIDLRAMGGVVDGVTDNTALIRDLVQNVLPPYSALYIPPGTEWNYSGIYNYLSDYQTIIDDSGRDKPRNVWQTGRYTWRRTNSATEATSGNTEGIAGNYHPAYFIDTYAEDGTAGTRASVVYRHQGVGKWQLMLDHTADKVFALAQYGGQVYGTKVMSFGHQDDPNVMFKVGFNYNLNASAMLYNYGKSLQLDDSTPHNTQYHQPASSTANFQKHYRYGTTSTYREDIKPDGTHEVISKNSRRITTTANCVRFGTRLNIKSLTASALLNVDESTSYITNIDATVSITASLPKAATGLVYEFSVDAAYGLRVQPNAADKFFDKAIGKYKESAGVGSKLRVVAVSDNAWSYEQAGTWTDQA